MNEFVKKIIVHAPDKSGGHRVQKIQVIFNFIGEFARGLEFVPDKKNSARLFLSLAEKLLPYQCRTLNRFFLFAFKYFTEFFYKTGKCINNCKKHTFREEYGSSKVNIIIY